MYGYIALDWNGNSKEEKEHDKLEIIELAYEYHIDVWFSEVNYREYDHELRYVVTYGTDDILVFNLKDTYTFIDFMSEYMHRTGQAANISDIDEFICDAITVTTEEYTEQRPRRK